MPLCIQAFIVSPRQSIMQVRFGGLAVIYQVKLQTCCNVCGTDILAKFSYLSTKSTGRSRCLPCTLLTLALYLLRASHAQASAVLLHLENLRCMSGSAADSTRDPMAYTVGLQLFKASWQMSDDRTGNLCMTVAVNIFCLQTILCEQLSACRGCTATL